MQGPQNTSSSRRTGSYTETLFWIFTLLPMTTSLATKTFCPSEQPAPMRAPEQTCAQCQMRVPSPIVRSEEHTSELQSLMRISYAVFRLEKKHKPETPVPRCHSGSMAHDAQRVPQSNMKTAA